MDNTEIYSRQDIQEMLNEQYAKLLSSRFADMQIIAEKTDVKEVKEHIEDLELQYNLGQIPLDVLYSSKCNVLMSLQGLYN